MDEENSNVNRLDTVLGVQEDKSVGSKINSFIKKFKGIPEDREVRLTARANFNKVDQDLRKSLKNWDKMSKRQIGNPLVNYLFGDKGRVKQTKRVFAELEATAKKSSAKYNARLNALQGEDRLEREKKGEPFGGEWGKTNQAIENSKVAIDEAKAKIEELIQQRDRLLEQKKGLELLPNEKKTLEAIEKAQRELAELSKKRDEVASKRLNIGQGKKTVDTDSSIIMEKSKELNKLAGGFYERTGGDESLFTALKKDIDATTKEDETTFAALAKQLKSWSGKKGAQIKKLNALRGEYAQSPTNEMSAAIAETEAELNNIQNEIDRLSSDKEVAAQHLKVDKNRKAQFEHYYSNKDKPQDFAQDKNYKTEEFAAKFDAMMRKKTASTKDMTLDIGKFSTAKQLENVDTSIEQTRNKIKMLQDSLKNISADSSIDSVVKELETKNIELDKAENNLRTIETQAKELKGAFEKIEAEIVDINTQLGYWAGDMKTNPFNAVLKARDAQRINNSIDDINAKTKRWYQVLKKSNVVTRIIKRTMVNIRSQISDMLNPLTLFRKGWDDWLNRFDNAPWKNTFDVISYNLVTALAPVFEMLAVGLIKLAQVANVFIKQWTGVDLFDKSAWSLEQIKKGMGQLTASFDELHSNNDNPNQFNTIFDTDPSKISPLSEETTEKLQGIATKIKDIWNGVTGFIKEHPIASAIIGGTALLLGPKALGGLLLGAGKLIGKGAIGLGKLAWNGLKTVGPKIWTGVKTLGKKIVDPNTWKSVGTGLKAAGTKVAEFMGKGLYTGMNGATVTMGKFLGGTALVATGVLTAGKSAVDAGKNWQDYNTAQKAAKVGGVALGSAAAGLGAVMLGASGPVGWAVAGVVALGSFVVGMGQVQDGIGSVKKEQEAWTQAQENLAIANQNWNVAMENSTNALAQLEMLERQTGISGEELYKSVQNGTVSVDQMTSSQLQVYNAYVQSKEASDQLKQAIKDKAKYEKEEAEGMIRTALAARKKKDDYTEAKDAILKAVEEEKISTEEAADYFSRLMGNMKKDAREALLEEIPEDIRQCVEPTKYASGWEKFGIGWNNFWSGVWEGTKTFVGNIGKAIGDGWEAIKTGASTAWENIKTGVSTKWEEIKTNAADTWENMKTKAGEKWEEIKNSAIGQKVQEIYSNVSTKWGELKTKTTEKFQEIWGNAKDKWENIKSTVSTKANDAFTKAKDKWNELKSTTKTIFDNIWSNTKTAFSNIATTIGDKAKEAFNKAKGWFEDIKEKAKEAWESVKDWGSNVGEGWKQDGIKGAWNAAWGKEYVPSYDVGTNYVPNDQLAYIHKGEAVIPAKYNKPYAPTSNSSGLESTVAAMTQEIANLRGLIQGGIPVRGEFKQRGSDLVAVVEKGRNKNGNQPLSNPAYAR